MSLHLASVVIDALDPEALAGFWGAVLGREVSRDDDGDVVLRATSEPGLDVCFEPTDVPWPGLGRMHFDLTSTSDEDQARTVELALSLGAHHLDVGQQPEDEHVVLADPEGNEFCVIEAGNRFLAGTDRIGALSCDGSRQVGLFWSAALGWPLVWDEGEETAIQHPDGGSKISWGGPPYKGKTRKNRLHLDVAPPPGGDQEAEVRRLEALGARRVDIGQGGVSWVVMADPDGNELCVLRPL